jgi:hypothetical protein
MKLAVYTIIFVSLLAMSKTVLSTNCYSADLGLSILRSDVSGQPWPLLLGAHLDGKKLIVEGANFDPGAVIRINHKKQKTEPNPDSPATVLLSKKGGKKIKPDDPTVTVQVENGDGQRSNVAYLYRTNSFAARLIIFGRQPELGLIHLKANGYILIDSRFLPSTDRFDPNFFRQVLDPPFDTSVFRLYQALGSGDTGFEINQQPYPNDGPPPPPIIWRLAIHIE